MSQMAELRASHGLPPTPVTRHLVFTGNPGTGKTTVARLLAQIYARLGLLSRGTLVECSRSDLVAGFVGQTAQRTTEIVRRALGASCSTAWSSGRVSGWLEWVSPAARSS